LEKGPWIGKAVLTLHCLEIDAMLPDLQPYFAALPDPRRETQNKLHKLNDIVMIMLCAVLSGVEDWVGMALFAQEEGWLRHFLTLPNGISSHDTLSDVLGRIEPGVFTAAFTRWAQDGLSGLAGEAVAIDGKTLCGTRGAAGAVHLMSAFATQARWVLGQEAVAETSNEIQAIPSLLEQLDLTGAVVITDARGCQKTLAQAIGDQQADYVFVLKANHKHLYEDVRLWLDTEFAQGRLPCHETIDTDHGRIETRRYALSTAVDWLETKPAWPGLQAVGMAEAIREVDGQVSVERRYFLCSLCDVQRFAEAVRARWAIENQQHWVLGRTVWRRCLPRPERPQRGELGADSAYHAESASPRAGQQAQPVATEATGCDQ
jgi:predicted transposase YbfD/YdcC